MSIHYYVVLTSEAEDVLDFTIIEGESLLTYGVEDFSQIMSWINLADLSLELMPSCRESLNSCLDWDATNRERVEVALSVLRDARRKLDNPLYTVLLNPSRVYRMLIERICDRRRVFSSPRNPARPSGLSYRDFLLEEQP